MKSKMLFLFILLTGANIAQALYEVNPTELEFLSSSLICKYTLASRYTDLAVSKQYKNTPSSSYFDVIGDVGGWHYCGGAIILNRARVATDKEEKLKLLERAIKDITYSYKKIDKAHPWAVDMAISLAKAYQELEEDNEGVKVLSDLSEYHPKDVQLIKALGLIHYYNSDYENALKSFKQADELTSKTSGEIAYFLGLTVYKMADYPAATFFADRAQQQGYPFQGLRKLLKKAESSGDK